MALIARLRSLVRRAHVTVLSYRLHQLRQAAALARRYSRDTFLMVGSSKASRLMALDAWKDAGHYESQAEEVLAKLQKLEAAQ